MNSSLLIFIGFVKFSLFFITFSFVTFTFFPRGKKKKKQVYYLIIFIGKGYVIFLYCIYRSSKKAFIKKIWVRVYMFHDEIQ